MFDISDDKTIHLTRGDIGVLSFSVKDSNGEDYAFGNGDVVRFKVVRKRDHEDVILQKDILINGSTTVVDLFLTKEDTTIGDIINKPVDYWYEVELNPDTASQTFVGYDEDGAKIFRLYPEGGTI